MMLISGMTDEPPPIPRTARDDGGAGVLADYQHFFVCGRGDAMTYDLEKLPGRLKEARAYTAMTQVQLATRAGLDAQQIYQYEHGKCRPSAMALTCLAMALGVPVDWLLGGGGAEAC